ncbi:uncharacterized protein N7483_012328 [Penicillium malachiteum]|uniref:uncharacterized protein n=1 Tax=Penicillium malachiteum TaxID=1324776 RepID=UPI002548FA75|nr:uncharacterized protein N7483_012328 [Penicillium malachiteum]KAJ5715147.1 hypothetical protein N7483_012328 [Penicillium malachiteum]
MHGLVSAITTLLLATSALCARSSQNPPGRDAILLSNVNTLTLRGDRMTSARRVSPIPQLKCVGPSKRVCELYQPDTMRCKNEGYEYDEEVVQWTCQASLPTEFKLGATDVVCEGYRNSNDKWILKGSCGVEYRLLLTEQGERRYGKIEKDSSEETSLPEFFGKILLGVFMLAVFAVILIAVTGGFSNRDRRQGRGGRGGIGGNDGGPGGGGGGGGGGAYGPYPRGPPPSYGSWNKPSSSQGWTPGFWSGAMGGAAAGYGAGRYSANTGSSRASTERFSSYDAGEGSSTRSTPSSNKTSTGFGSTKRR